MGEAASKPEEPAEDPREREVRNERRSKDKVSQDDVDYKIPQGLLKVMGKFTEEQQTLLKNLCSPEYGQVHLFKRWPKDANASPPVLRQMVKQLEQLDADYPGGLLAYIQNAKRLLEDSRKGVNPLDGWEPSVPKGQSFELGTEEYKRTEKEGLKELGNVGFVLVAGGLGERLGYGNVKVGLPTETTTMTSYLQYYCEYIYAVQKKFGGGKLLPLCIMVSKDTINGTMELLKKHKYFRLKRRQITIVQQGNGVPALMDNEARFATEPTDNYTISTKPHGHGDIHALLYKNGVTKKWEESYGIKWMVIFQDTNGLAFHTLPLMLGVSKQMGFIMNSLAVPRKAKQAIGGIAKLTNKETGEVRTVNVEYNQLDPLLRSTTYEDGDVNDPKTGFSPFPGNINQLLFRLDGYNAALERTKGVMPEFVNPKYKDGAKLEFKKPTRLECMMQDFPTVLEGDEAKQVGFTQISSDLCFSPVKNATADGVKLQEKGVQPGTAATGESDQYAAVRKILRSVGVQIEDAPKQTYLGIEAIPGPCIVFKPDFVSCPGEYLVKFPCPEKVKISSRSTLVVRGPGVVIESLELDGTLLIDVDRGEEVTVRDLHVENGGWVRVPETGSDDEIIKMRGYVIKKKDQRVINIENPDGEKDDDDDEDDEGDDEKKMQEPDNCTIL